MRDPSDRPERDGVGGRLLEGIDLASASLRGWPEGRLFRRASSWEKIDAIPQESWPCAARTTGPTSPSSKPGSTWRISRTRRPTRSPGFNDRLKAWLPSMIEHHVAASASAGGFFETAAAGNLPGPHPGARLARAPVPGRDGSRLRSRPARPPRTASTRSRSSTKKRSWEALALERGLELCLAAVYDRPFDIDAESRIPEGPPSPGPAQADRPGLDRRGRPRKRKIPTRRLNAEGLILLGHGARQRRAQGSMHRSDRARSPNRSRATSVLSRTMLRAIGVPVPDDDPDAARVPGVDASPAGRRRSGGRGQRGSTTVPSSTSLDRVHPEIDGFRRRRGPDRLVSTWRGSTSWPGTSPGRWVEQRGVVSAVQAAPDLAIHLDSAGKVLLDRWEPSIVDSLFDPGDNGPGFP